MFGKSAILFGMLIMSTQFETCDGLSPFTIYCVLAAASALGLGAVFAPVIVAWLGFQATGIAAGSWAASMMASAAAAGGGGVGAGSLVAFLQSIGAGGAVLPGAWSAFQAAVTVCLQV